MSSSRTILVTGGAGGIGKAVAAAFAASGDTVVVADLESDAVASVVRSLQGTDAGIDHSGLVVDITDELSVAAAISQIEHRYDQLDVLVNNAGILSLHGTVLDLPASAMDRILRTNVLGTFLITQQVVRHLVARGTGGSIVNVSSIGGRQPTPGMGAYEASKAAIDSLTRWAAIELADAMIRVNAVAPGPVLTEMIETGMPSGSPEREAWLNRIPLHRLAGVADVAAAVHFLASPAAAHITGVSLPVDGGQLLT